MVEINQNTKISFLLKNNPDSLDALVALNPKFQRLKNPLLRKLLAKRTSIREASRIGKCEIQKIADALKPLGFEFVEAEPDSGKGKKVPDFVKNLDKLPYETLDVRADIEGGKDPLKKIMQTVKNLPADHVLKLINSFEPTPLITVLEKKGYEYYVKEADNDEVHTFFKLKANKKDGQGDLEAEIPDEISEEVFTEKLNSYGDKIQSVDVSELEMPMPMVTILGALEELPEGFALSVHHRRIPVFLFSQLRDRGYEALLFQPEESKVRLLIFKAE